MSWNSEGLRGSNGAHIPVRAFQDFDHAMIHMGCAFTLSNRHDNISGSGVFDHLFVVGKHSLHMRELEVIATEAPFSLRYYYAPTVTDNGTLETIFNNNGNSSLVTDAAIYGGPTVTNVGTQVGEDLWPSYGSGGHGGQVATLAGGEWIMPANSVWLIRFTNEGSKTADISHTYFYYEPGLVRMHP